MAEAETATIPLDRMAKAYRKIRSKLDELRTEYDTKEAELKAELDVISSAMKDQLLASGVTSVKTEQGTIILGKTTRYSTTDWDSFKQFVREEDALDLFERRIAQTNMAKYLEQNPDKLPPGLNSNSEYTISVRKPGARA